MSLDTQQFAAELGQRWIPIKNTGSQVIPPWGVCEIEDTATANGAFFYKAKRPTADSLARVVVNGPMEVPVNGFGRGTHDWPTVALYDTGDSPAVGDSYGTQTDKFTLKEDNTGFLIVGSSIGSGTQSRVPVIGLSFTASGGISPAIWRARSNNSISSDGGGAMEFGTFKTLDITADFVETSDVDADAGISYDDSTGHITFTKSGLYIVHVHVRLTVLDSVALDTPQIVAWNFLQFDTTGSWVGNFGSSDPRMTLWPNTSDGGSTRGGINQRWELSGRQMIESGDKMRIYGFNSIIGSGISNSDVTMSTFYTEIAYVG